MYKLKQLNRDCKINNKMCSISRFRVPIFTKCIIKNVLHIFNNIIL